MPEGHVEVCLEGETVKIPEDGVICVQDAHADDLVASHGALYVGVMTPEQIAANNADAEAAAKAAAEAEAAAKAAAEAKAAEEEETAKKGKKGK